MSIESARYPKSEAIITGDGFSIDFEELLRNIKEGIIDVAREEAEAYIEQATYDAIDFVDRVRGNLLRWAPAVVNGQLTTEEVMYLLKAQQNLVVMHSLSQVGLATARLERIRDGIIDVIVSSLASLV
jgi:hypothetical protein